MRKFKSIHTGRVYTEIFSDEKGLFLEHQSGYRCFFKHNEIEWNLIEIKEPVKITFWKNLWQRRDGSYFFGCDWSDEKSAKRDAYDVGETTIKYIKTVKFETEIEQ